MPHFMFFMMRHLTQLKHSNLFLDILTLRDWLISINQIGTKQNYSKHLQSNY